MAEIRIACEGAATLPLDALEPFQGELKTLDKADAARLRHEILADGFSDPFNVWRNRKHNWIIDGHQRRAVLYTLRAEGYEVPDLPVVWVEADSFAQAKRKVLAQASQYGRVTLEGLTEIAGLAELEFDDLTASFRFPEIDFDLMKDPPEDDSEAASEMIDRAEELREKWGVERGQVWTIPGKAGMHRVMCGDSTDEGDVAVLMDGEKVGILIADPPYGMNLDTDYSQMAHGDRRMGSTSVKYARVVGDDKPFIPAAVAMPMPDEQFWFGADYYASGLGDTEHRCSWLVWDKRVEESADRMFGSCFELVWSAKRRKREILRHKWAGFFTAGEKRDFLHPTTKPVSLIARLISWGEGNVADPFLGSGTTVVAAEQEGRIAFGMEISEKYVAVVLERMASHGLEPVMCDD